MKNSLRVAIALLAFPAALSAQTVVYGNGSTVTNASPGDWADPSCAATSSVWCATNVRQTAEVGITTNYANAGNGSLYFASTSGTGKSDFQYLFASPFALAALDSFGYEFYRDASTTVSTAQNPAMRMMITDGQGHFGTLVYETAYNSGPTTTDQWNSVAVGSSTNLWLYMSGCGVFESYGVSLGTWQTTGATNNCGTTVTGDWYVYGMNVGIGSGWNGNFEGAVDNVSYKLVGQGGESFNFEVARQPVPEPSVIALIAGGLLGMGAAARRRRKA